MLCSTTDLQRFHCTLRHTSVKATRNLLKRAEGHSVDKETSKFIREIAEQCKACAKNSSGARRFRLTVGSEESRFNHYVEVDTMCIDGHPVVHIIDRSTHFFAATFLKRQRASDIWNSNHRIWTLAHCGPPEFLTIDQGSNHASVAFRSCFEAERQCSGK